MGKFAALFWTNLHARAHLVAHAILHSQGSRLHEATEVVARYVSASHALIPRPAHGVGHSLGD